MRATTKRGRVLVVDDQPANLRVVSALLERQGFDVALAETGEAALDAAEAEPPDLLLLDMMMPGMDGFGVMQEIRRRELPKVPVVVLTAAQDRGLLLQAFEAGAVDYVIKPFIPEELLARVHAHIGLKLARDRLEQVARERQELVNLVAHDLKNPLTSVVFAADILASGTLQPDRVPRYLQVIRESAEDGLGYIRRYLETQASARGAASARDARVALGDVVEWIIGRYGLQFEDSGCRLSIGEVGGAVVAMDGLVLRQVVGNLISNAINHGQPGTAITVSAARQARHGRVAVRNIGTTIPPDELGQIWERFHQAGGRPLGTGLGLAIVKTILEQHQVNFGVQSDQGVTVFWFAAPVADL